MDSRNKILSNLPKDAGTVLEWRPSPANVSIPPLELFSNTLRSIGGAVVELKSIAGVQEFLHQHYQPGRIVSTIDLYDGAGTSLSDVPQAYDDVEVSVLQGNFGVAENGAVWITDDALPDRVLPFICQHLVVVLDKKSIVATLHEAYARIGGKEYSFGTFIAGPSKTADIEQSLVLGAHGPKTMTVLLIDQ